MKIHIFLKQTICSSVPWHLTADKVAHITWTGKPPATVTLRQDVKAIIRSLSSEIFILAKATSSLARTNKAFCYRTVNSILSQMKIYNFYQKWIYYITFIIIITICSVVAYRFPVIYYFFIGIVYIPHMVMVVLRIEKFTYFIFRPWTVLHSFLYFNSNSSRNCKELNAASIKTQFSHQLVRMRKLCYSKI